MSCLLFVLAIKPLAAMLRNSNLQGFQIPGTASRLITTLFADDTAVYLSMNDKFNNLQDILSKWCSISDAKFNVPKTEMIPIGSAEYRNTLLQSRKMKDDHNPIPDHIHIAEDREPTRILGAWIGNHIDNATPLTPILESIERELNQWGKSHPTLEGQKFICQQIVAGKTQYLAKVQEMPPHIEKALTKTIKTFMWNKEGTAPVNLETLYAPIENGGRNLVDINARNKAIQLTWVKAYLNIGPQRPIWAFIADSLINRNIPEYRHAKDPLSIVNVFLQTIKPSIRSGTTIPADLVSMLKTAKEFNVCFEVVLLSDSLKGSLPIWFHIGATKELNKLINTEQAECLRGNHKAITIKDITSIAHKNHPHHHARRNCACPNCKHDRLTLHCINPTKCRAMANKLLGCIQPKWHPTSQPPVDNLNLSQEQLERNNLASIDNEPILFNPNVMTSGNISDGFRVFTDTNTSYSDPAYRPGPQQPVTDETTVYTDGSCLNNGQQDAQAGSGIWYGPNDARNTALKIPGDSQSNQLAEITVVLHVATNSSSETPLLIKSDSMYAINGLTKHLSHWEDIGWIGVSHKDTFKATATRIRMRPTETRFQWVKGHSGEMGNEEADKLANQGAQKNTPDPINLSIQNKFNINGAKLMCTTQAILYRGIKELKQAAPRNSTIIQLDITRHAAKDLSGNLPTDSRIWRLIRSKDISRQIRCFLWKCLHNAYKCGPYWRNIPEYEHWGTCPICHEDESMAHILTECRAPGQKEIWDLAKQLWQQTPIPWPRISYGSILACGLTNFKDNKGNTLTGLNHLFRILISESAYLIWKIRCEHRIEREDDPTKQHSHREIHNRW